MSWLSQVAFISIILKKVFHQVSISVIDPLTRDLLMNVLDIFYVYSEYTGIFYVSVLQ